MHVILNRITNKIPVLLLITSTLWKGNCTKGWFKKEVVWIFWLFRKYITFNVFVHWLLIQVGSIPCYRETTDAMMTISAIESVWVIWSRASYYLLVRWQLWIPFKTNRYLYYIVGTHLTYLMDFWSEPETGNNEIYVYAHVSCVFSIKRYGIVSMPFHSFQDDANCRIDNNHVETLTIWEKMKEYLRSHSIHWFRETGWIWGTKQGT